jgi:hypothetical protein
MSQLSEVAMRVVTDNKTHFPLLEIKDIGSLTLWPIMKLQFEMYISQINQYGDTWYDEILKCNPRVSYHQVSKKNYERLFITGLHIEEVLSFSKWFGEDFRIPTAEEWREIYILMDTQPDFSPPSDMSYQANTIWKKIAKFSNSPIKFSFLKEGVIEWVSTGESYAGKGDPRPSLLPHAFKPSEDIIKFKRDERRNYLGFRLIKGFDHE